MRKPAAILFALSLAVLALALVPAAGLAAKGGNGGGGHGGGGKPGGGGSAAGGTIALVPDGVPHFGQQVTFAVSTTATSYPWVTVTCNQGGSVVYKASRGIFPTSLSQYFTLGPTPSWSGGDADCAASLENWDAYPKISTLTSISFHVDP